MDISGERSSKKDDDCEAKEKNTLEFDKSNNINKIWVIYALSLIHI